MKTEQFEMLLRFFKALADESRLKIVGILASQECSVEELAVLLRLKEPTISHHLARLKELELVIMRVEGNSHIYKLNKETLQNINKEIFTPLDMSSLVENVENEEWENKILGNYLESQEGGEDLRLKEIPASRKKRLVILKWLANRFEFGITYTENNVNKILKEYHPDYATLRRELISAQFMKRENGVYWRPTDLF
jgi:predicted transcriptional regulator